MRIMKFTPTREKVKEKVNLDEIIEFDKRKREELREAAFRPGMASSMVEKIASILSRRTGLKIGISSIAISVVIGGNPYDTYFGYISPNRAFRLNFLTNKSDFLHSIDFYNSNTDTKPSVRLDLNGFNIVQVIDQIADYLTGDYDRYDESYVQKNKKLTERAATVQEMVLDWIESTPSAVNDIKSGRFDYEKHAQIVLNHMRTSFGSTKSKFNSGALKHYVKQISLQVPSLGLNSNSVPSITVANVTTNEFTPPTKDLQEIWDAAMNTSPRQIMDTLEYDARRLARGDKLLPGMLVYGKPGTGKTQTITDVMKEEGVKPILIDEKLTAYSRLLWAIYEYRSGQIIIIDDNDSIFDNEDNVNLLKTVLDMKPVRRVNISQPVKIMGSSNVVQESFDFESKMIFISNRLKMDTAIKSRLSGVMHEINFTKEEMLDLIKHNLYKLYSEVKSITNDMRDDVFDFVETILPGINDIDYRAFNYCITYCHAARLSGAPERTWKERSVRLLKDYGKEPARRKF